MALPIPEVETRQRVCELLQFRKNEGAPPVPWHLISDANDDNPFMGFTITTTWERWHRTPYQDTVDAMYSSQPGTHPDHTFAHKLPDAAHTSPENLVTHHLPRPFNPQHYSQQTRARHDDETALSPVDFAKVINTLTSNPEDKHMKASTTTSGWGTINVNAMDRRNVEEARKLAVCFVASQLLLSDPSIVEAVPITFNMPLSATSDSNYIETTRFMPVNHSIYLRFNDGCANTILPLSVDLLGPRKRPFLSQRFSSVYANTGTVHHRNLGPYFMGWDKNTGAESLLELFSGFPLLMVNDE